MTTQPSAYGLDIAQSGDNPDLLLCPYCGSDCTHQGTVEVFNRSQEDSVEGTHAVIDGPQVQVDSSLAGNPSGRRQGVNIWFICEQCPHEFRLTIAQHKGGTFLQLK